MELVVGKIRPCLAELGLARLGEGVLPLCLNLCMLYLILKPHRKNCPGNQILRIYIYR